MLDCPAVKIKKPVGGNERLYSARRSCCSDAAHAQCYSMLRHLGSEEFARAQIIMLIYNNSQHSHKGRPCISVFHEIPTHSSREYMIRSVPNSSDRLIFVKRRAKDGRSFSKNTGIIDGQKDW